MNKTNINFINRNVKPITIQEAFRKLNGANLIAYVIPNVGDSEYDKEEPTQEDRLVFQLTTFINDEFFIIAGDLSSLGSPNDFRPGMRLVIPEFKPGTDPDEIEVRFKKRVPVKEHHRIKLATVKGVELSVGQSILVTAPPQSGKSYVTELILDSAEKECSSTVLYKLLLGERSDDSLGYDTIDCDSTAPIDYQLSILYEVLTRAVRDAYLGKRVVFAIDSFLRLVDTLTNKYSHTHLTSGGISVSCKVMVSSIFRMNGQYENGTLTMVGTCLWSGSNTTWKNVYSELSSIATAEFHPDDVTGKLNSTRRKPIKTKRKILKIFGREINFV